MISSSQNLLQFYIYPEDPMAACENSLKRFTH
jgi:hypothetical protein